MDTNPTHDARAKSVWTGIGKTLIVGIASVCAAYGAGLVAAGKVVDAKSLPISTERMALEAAVAGSSPERMASLDVPALASDQSQSLQSQPGTTWSYHADAATEGQGRSAANIRDGYAANLTSEVRDGSWAFEATRTIHSRFGGLASGGTSVESIDCRATMCQLDLVSESQAAYDTFLREALSRGPAGFLWNAPLFLTSKEDREQDGKVRMVAYIAREGKGLPALDD